MILTRTWRLPLRARICTTKATQQIQKCIQNHSKIECFWQKMQKLLSSGTASLAKMMNSRGFGSLRRARESMFGIQRRKVCTSWGCGVRTKGTKKYIENDFPRVNSHGFGTLRRAQESMFSLQRRNVNASWSFGF
jgi:hypothetical protein